MEAIEAGMVGGRSEFKRAKVDLSHPKFAKLSNIAQQLWGSSICVDDESEDDVVIGNGPSHLLADLRDYTFVLNEKPIQGVYVGERVFGSLLRLILAMDGQSVRNSDDERISEVQAARHARDCLKMITDNRENYASTCLQVVNALCRNKGNLVSIQSVPVDIPYHVEIIVKSKRHTETPPTLVRGSDQNRRAWIYSRTSSFKPAKRCYAILSLGVITYYRQALPRPHHLIDQDFLGRGMSVGFFERDDKLQEDTQTTPLTLTNFGHIIYIRSKSRTRQLCFLDEDVYQDWKQLITVAVQSTMKSCRSMDDTEIKSRRLMYCGSSSDLALVAADTVALYTTDENGIDWLALPNHRPRPEQRTMLGLSTRILQSAALMASDQLPKPNISRLVSVANLPSMSLGLLPALSQRLSVRKGVPNGFTCDSDVLETDIEHDSQPTVQVEIRLATLTRLRKKDDSNTVLSSIRAISHLSMNLSSSTMCRAKRVKVDALKGSASLETFRLFFDNERRLSRRATAP